MNNKSNSLSKTNLTPFIIAIILIFCIIVFVIIFISNSNTTITIADTANDEINATLICKAEDEPLVFSNIDHQNTTQEYRGTFVNNNLQSISYIFKAKYNDEETAERINATIHADHNIYMGSLGHSSEDYNPAYSNNGTTVQATFFAKKDELDVNGSKIFQLDWGKPLTLNNIQQNYEFLGYNCEIIDGNK